jgi:hypothetical protein
MAETTAPHLEKKRALARASAVLLQAACVLVALLALLLVYYRTDAATSSLTILKDCTIPGHACYDDGHKSTTQAIYSINKVSILAAYCAKQPELQTVAQIQRCVMNHLK